MSGDFQIAELFRQLSNLIRVGSIVEVDDEAARVRVQISGNKTKWLPLAGGAAGTVRTYRMPAINEQCLIFSPSGNLANGVVLAGISSAVFPAAGNSSDLFRALFDDGAVIDYDQATHTLRAELPDGGKFDVAAPGGTTINGPLKVNGKTELVGDVDTTGALKNNGKSVGSTLRVTGVQSGSSTSGVPI